MIRIKPLVLVQTAATFAQKKMAVRDLKVTRTTGFIQKYEIAVWNKNIGAYTTVWSGDTTPRFLREVARYRRGRTTVRITYRPSK